MIISCRLLLWHEVVHCGNCSAVGSQDSVHLAPRIGRQDAWLSVGVSQMQIVSCSDVVSAGRARQPGGASHPAENLGLLTAHCKF